MPVKNILLITNWERETGRADAELSHSAKSQMKKLVQKIFSYDLPQPFALRISDLAHSSYDTLSYFTDKMKVKFVWTNNDNESLYHNAQREYNNLQTIIESTQKARTVVVWVTQDELKDILNTMRSDSFQWADTDIIDWKHNIYSALVDIKEKSVLIDTYAYGQ